MQRNAAIDKLRILLTMLVIFHHAAIIYGGSGGWYWREEDNATNLLLVGFNAINQSYFMGFFFLLAGYFTPPSFNRKGPGPFMVERLLRMGVPLLVYFFVISPFTIALANNTAGESIWVRWWAMTTAHEFEPGPLWFLAALLLCATGFTLWKLCCPNYIQSFKAFPQVKWLALAAVGIGLVSFAVRLLIPVGESILWLQLGYFPCYILLFVAGCAASHTRLLETITLKEAMPWMLISVIAIISLSFMLVKPMGNGAFEGGWNLNAIYYALWDPAVAWGVMLGLLWSFHRFFSNESYVSNFLARRIFTVYIIHPPVLVVMSMLLESWALMPLFKFLLVSTLSCIGCVVLAAIILLIPGARRIL